MVTGRSCGASSRRPRPPTSDRRRQPAAQPHLHHRPEVLRHRERLPVQTTADHGHVVAKAAVPRRDRYDDHKPDRPAVERGGRQHQDGPRSTLLAAGDGIERREPDLATLRQGAQPCVPATRRPRRGSRPTAEGPPRAASTCHPRPGPSASSAAFRDSSSRRHAPSHPVPSPPGPNGRGPEQESSRTSARTYSETTDETAPSDHLTALRVA